MVCLLPLNVGDCGPLHVGSSIAGHFCFVLLSLTGFLVIANILTAPEALLWMKKTGAMILLQDMGSHEICHEIFLCVLSTKFLHRYLLTRIFSTFNDNGICLVMDVK